MRLLFIPLLALCMSSAFSQSGPELQVDSIVDLGIISEGDSVSHTFTLTNTGDQTLIINEIEVTCTCLSTELSMTSILAGQEASIVVWFNTEGKMGRQHKLVALKTNALEPVTMLSIMAEIVPSD